MLSSVRIGAVTAARASLGPVAKKIALGSLTRLADPSFLGAGKKLSFSTLREEDDQERMEEIEAATEAKPDAFGGLAYDWEDPFRLKSQLTEEEVRYLYKMYNLYCEPRFSTPHNMMPCLIILWYLLLFFFNST